MLKPPANSTQYPSTNHPYNHPISQRSRPFFQPLLSPIKFTLPTPGPSRENGSLAKSLPSPNSQIPLTPTARPHKPSSSGQLGPGHNKSPQAKGEGLSPGLLDPGYNTCPQARGEGPSPGQIDPVLQTSSQARGEGLSPGRLDPEYSVPTSLSLSHKPPEESGPITKPPITSLSLSLKPSIKPSLTLTRRPLSLPASPTKPDIKPPSLSRRNPLPLPVHRILDLLCSAQHQPRLPLPPPLHESNHLPILSIFTARWSDDKPRF